ncbi:MAG: TRAP transporter large permease [Clostridiales bacterium]|nr:TRAP transporter large permease [Clostridiales bacterium]
MSNALILIIFFAIMLSTLFLGTPVSFSLGFAGVLGVILWVGSARLSQIGVITYTQGTHMNQLILPMFIMMSEFLSNGGVAENIFTVLNKSVGKLKGGLAIATTIACTIFAALCGSSPATAASIGKISIQEMTKRGYSPEFAVGTVAAGGTLGIMIPPSLTFCIYAAITENSIVQLFMAGVVPGLMLSALIILSIVVRVRLNPGLINYAPEGGGSAGRAMDAAGAKEVVEAIQAAAREGSGAATTTANGGEAASGKGKEPTFLTILPALALIFIVLGSMYFGFATPVEAAGYGVVGAFLIIVFQRKLTLKMFSQTITSAAKTGAMMIFLIICGTFMTFVVSYLGIPQEISATIANSGLNRYVVLLLMYALWFILGALMDPTSMVLLTIPFLYRTLMMLEFNPLWVGVALVLGSQIAMITPPVGMNLFVLKANTGLPMNTVIKGAVPYVLILLFGLALITVFPGIATWLPSRMF